MKQKKKGFTLTEIIAVIVILAILVLIGIPAYNSIRKQVLQTQYENVVGLIETEAAKYASKKGTSLTNVKQLIEEGLIETDDGKNLLDPRNQKTLNCKLIEITYTNGVYESKMIDTEECDLAEAQAKYGVIDILIKKLSNNETISNGEWVNEDVKLSVKASNLSAGDSIVDYRWISGSGQSSAESTMTTNVSTILNTTVNVEITTEKGYKYFASVIVRVDKEQPLIKSVTTSGGNDWTRGRDVKIEATDQNGSGMYGYYLGTEPCGESTVYKEVANIKDEVNVESILIYEPTEYYVCVKDQVGNVTEYPEALMLQVEDTISPTCVWSGENTEWTNDPVEVILTCDDAESGCNVNYSTYSSLYETTQQTDTISYTIKDNAGNTTLCTKEVDVYVDTDKPTAPTTMNFVYEDWSVYTDSSWTNSNVYAGRTRTSPGPTGATDEDSGVAKYQISSDGTTWVDFNYNYQDTMYQMSSSGIHTRYFRAVDSAGNVSDSISRTAKIDKAKPTCGSITGQSTTWTKNNRTLYQGCSDSGSECVQSSYSKTYDTTTKTATMSTTISDNAGNTKNCSSTVNVYVDKSGPTITFGTDGSSYATQASTTVSAADSESGVNTIKYGWSTSSSSTTANTAITSGTTTSSTCNYSGSGGDCYLYVQACDKLGNCNTKRSKNFLIDRQAPTIVMTSKNFADCKAAYGNSSTTVCKEFQATDPQTTNLSELYFVRSHCFEGSDNHQFCSYTTSGTKMTAVARRNYFVNNNANYATMNMTKEVGKFLGPDNKTANGSIYSISYSGYFGVHTTASSSVTVQYAFRVCDRRMNCTDADFKSK